MPQSSVNRQLEQIFQTFYSSNRGLDPTMQSTMRDILAIPDFTVGTPGYTYYVSPLFAVDAVARTYTTIQAAIDAANALVAPLALSATVLVYPGIYDEHITLPGMVSVIGATRDFCIVAPSTSGPAVLESHTASRTRIRMSNMTIRNTGLAEYDYCYYYKGTVTAYDGYFYNCRFTSQNFNGVVMSIQGTGTMTNSLFERCIFEQYGGNGAAGLIVTGSVTAPQAVLNSEFYSEGANAYGAVFVTPQSFHIQSSKFSRSGPGSMVFFRNPTSTVIGLFVNASSFVGEHGSTAVEFGQVGAGGVNVLVAQFTNCSFVQSQVAYTSATQDDLTVFQNCGWFNATGGIVKSAGAGKIYVMNSSIVGFDPSGSASLISITSPAKPTLKFFDSSLTNGNLSVGVGASASILSIVNSSIYVATGPAITFSNTNGRAVFLANFTSNAGFTNVTPTADSFNYATGSTGMTG